MKDPWRNRSVGLSVFWVGVHDITLHRYAILEFNLLISDRFVRSVSGPQWIAVTSFVSDYFIRQIKSIDKMGQAQIKGYCERWFPSLIAQHQRLYVCRSTHSFGFYNVSQWLWARFITGSRSCLRKDQYVFSSLPILDTGKKKDQDQNKKINIRVIMTHNEARRRRCQAKWFF
jgi:hypothetical protein